MAGHRINFLQATEGRVLLDDRDVRLESMASLARTVGYPFQNPDNQFFMDTVTREIGFGLVNYGVVNLKERIANVIMEAGFEPFVSSPPLSLSRGQRQRVVVASILAMEPSVLVLDEPTNRPEPGPSQSPPQPPHLSPEDLVHAGAPFALSRDDSTKKVSEKKDQRSPKDFRVTSGLTAPTW
jgi:energy-coupling factor transport system ATP-binding protein